MSIARYGVFSLFYPNHRSSRFFLLWYIGPCYYEIYRYLMAHLCSACNYHLCSNLGGWLNIKMSSNSIAWWRHQMETFSALLVLCAGNSPVPGEFPTQRPVTRSFDVFFDLRPNKRLSKQSWCWWLETLSCPIWRHCNGNFNYQHDIWVRWQVFIMGKMVKGDPDGNIVSVDSAVLIPTRGLPVG